MAMRISAIRMRRSMAIVAAIALLAIGVAIAALVRGAPPGAGPPPAASRADGPVPGETYAWKPVAIGGGGFITGLSSDAGGATRVIRADVYGAYRWDAARDRWVQLVVAGAMPDYMRTAAGAAGGVYEIVVAPSDPRRLYMALKGAVFRSDDGGDHWFATGDPGPFPLRLEPNGEFRLYGPFMAVSPADPDLVLLGTPLDGLWRSADGGAHWARVPSVPPGRDLRPAPGVQTPGIGIAFAPGGGRLYAASPGAGLFASDDGGASFHAVGPPGEPRPATIRRAAFARDGGVWVADDEAKSAWAFRAGHWRDLTAAGALPAERFAGVAADPDGARVFVSDQGGDIWCSADGGAGWRRPWRTTGVGGAKEPAWLRVNGTGYFASGEIAFDPVDPARLWVAGGAGPYEADVGAEGCPFRVAWASRVRGIEELVANDAIQPPGHAPLFANWDYAIFRRGDLDRYPADFGPAERFMAAQQLDWSAGHPDALVTNASDTRMDCCSEDGRSVLAGTSMDGGGHWRRFATLPTPPGTKPDDPWRMSFGSIAIAAGDPRDIVWAPAFDRSPFATLDGGATWRRVVLPGEVGPLTGSFPAFYGGRKTLAADRVEPATFYLVHSGGGANAGLAGLWRSRDGGRGWERVFAGGIAPGGGGNSARLRAVPGHAGHLFFTAANGWGDDRRLRRSTDGGAHWAALDGVEAVDDIAFGRAARGAAYPTIFLSGQVRGASGIWRSTDDARSWQRLVDFPIGLLDQVNALAADPDMFGRVYVGYAGSGWVYGEPAPCRAADDRRCSRADP